MFDDLDQVDWAGLNAHEVPNFIRGLVSADAMVRNKSFDALIWTDLYERLDVACFVVPYILRILEKSEVNSETELLLIFIKNLRINATEFIKYDLAVNSAATILNQIDNSISIYRRLCGYVLAKDAAQDLLAEIDDD